MMGMKPAETHEIFSLDAKSVDMDGCLG